MLCFVYYRNTYFLETHFHGIETKHSIFVNWRNNLRPFVSLSCIEHIPFLFRSVFYLKCFEKYINHWIHQNFARCFFDTSLLKEYLLIWYMRYMEGVGLLLVRRAGLLWSQQDFEWRWSVPLFKCLTVLDFYFILFDLCLLITFFNFIMNYIPIVTFWIFTYHKIWILSIMFCFIWSYWIVYFLACLEVSWRVVS